MLQLAKQHRHDLGVDVRDDGRERRPLGGGVDIDEEQADAAAARRMSTLQLKTEHGPPAAPPATALPQVDPGAGSAIASLAAAQHMFEKSAADRGASTWYAA